MTMHHLVFSGGEQRADDLVTALEAAGFPARVDRLGCGFVPELLTLFVEALGDGDPDPATTVAAEFGFVLRMHGPVEERSPMNDPALERIALLESRLTALEANQ